MNERNFRQEALRDRELRSGVPKPFMNRPGYTPPSLADHTDLRMERHGEEVKALVDHSSLREAAVAKRDRSTWCSYCRLSRHARCVGRRRVHGFGFLPCLCPTCEKAGRGAPGRPETGCGEPKRGISLVPKPESTSGDCS